MTDDQIAYVKRRRAKDADDFETWVEGETAPTLNVFDNSGDVRATILSVEAMPIQGTVIGRSDSAGPAGPGYGQPGAPMFTLDTVSRHGVAQPIPIQDGREMEKKQNGLGIAGEGDPAYTLDTTGAQAVAQPIVFENSYRDGPRVGDDLCHTLPAKMGTGGGNSPMVAQVLAFDGTFSGYSSVTTDLSPTVKVESGLGVSSPPAVAQPIIYDGYNQKIDESGVHRTLRIGRDSSDFVAQPVADTETLGGSALAYDPESIGPLTATGMSRARGTESVESNHVLAVVAPPLTATNNPSRSPQSAEVTQQVGAVFQTTMVVRRLTPVECERLMGWPDDHTRWTVDGKEQADSHRYKQCGNGVAAPVAEWIGAHIMTAFFNSKKDTAA